MGYSVPIVCKGDVVIINGVRFRVKYDFYPAYGDKILLLKLEKNKPQTFVAQTEKETIKNTITWITNDGIHHPPEGVPVLACAHDGTFIVVHIAYISVGPNIVGCCPMWEDIQGNHFDLDEFTAWALLHTPPSENAVGE